MSTFNPWYLGNQQWAEPSQVHAASLMRQVYENRGEADDRGSRLKNYISTQYSWDAVADIIVGRLSNIR
jgi:hypothetical protein